MDNNIFNFPDYGLKLVNNILLQVEIVFFFKKKNTESSFEKLQCCFLTNLKWKTFCENF